MPKKNCWWILLAATLLLLSCASGENTSGVTTDGDKLDAEEDEFPHSEIDSDVETEADSAEVDDDGDVDATDADEDGESTDDEDDFDLEDEDLPEEDLDEDGADEDVIDGDMLEEDNEVEADNEEADTDENETEEDSEEDFVCILQSSIADHKQPCDEPPNPWLTQRRCERYEYDRQGRPVWRGTDWDCDSGNNSCHIWVYDDDEGKVTEGYDAKCDGVLDYGCKSRTYDAMGNLLLEQWIPGCDGQVNSYDTYAYDENGRLIAENPCDDPRRHSDRQGVATYDENGNMTRWTESLCTGEIVSCNVYTYDPQGNRQTEVWDLECDETADGECKAFTYDENGHQLTERWDRNCDGVPDDYCSVSAYDDLGRRTRFEEYWCCRNILPEAEPCFTGGEEPAREPQCRNYYYDDYGRLVREEYESSCTGTVYECVAYDYICWGEEPTDGDSDQEGNSNIAWPEHFCGLLRTGDSHCDGEADQCQFVAPNPWGGVYDPISYLDDECDGVPDVNCHYAVFDERGNLLHSKGDIDCDGGWDSGCLDHIYREDGILVFSVYDYNCDGSTERCEKPTYDRQGNLIYMEVGFSCEDLPFRCTVYTYDPFGRRVKQQDDSDCDGVADGTCEAYFYNEDEKRPYLQWRDAECDGIGDSNCLYSTFDDQGRRLTWWEDDDCNEEAEYCQSFTYDPSGNLTIDEDDEFCDGVEKTCFVATYDARDNRTSSFTDRGCDGIPDNSCTTMTYDENDQLVSETNDFDCSGAQSSSCSTYELVCY
ncbi:MAG: hypothetical protein C4523_08665 [Myxococcales bacterium]|nr:MAG: hypothetical protein C4523_08665 [Myxococcales bacterium]